MVRLRWYLLTLALLATGPLSAQTPAQPVVPDASALSRSIRESPGGSGVALEGVVDAEAYQVGPGDVFSFSIGGRFPVENRATVSADGMLIVPEVGSFRVGGRSLASVRSELRAGLRRRHANVDTDAALAEPRRFRVHVTGNVNAPGRHAVIPLARVEDALAAAMEGPPLAVLDGLVSDRAAVLPALRNVEVRHRDGSVDNLDLLRYYATGETEHNPYLRDGDVVNVPSFHRQGAAVFVEDRFGGVRLLDLRPFDTAADLVAVARGLNATSSLEAVRLIRVRPDGGMSVETFEGAGMDNALRTTTLQPLDRLLLVDPNETAGRIEVEGAVRFPGTYPVVEGVTTLRDVLELAGGLRPNALAAAAYLDRLGPSRPLSQPFDASLRLATLEDQAYEAGRLSAMEYEGRQYLTRELNNVRRVTVDLRSVIDGSAPPVPVYDGDYLVVPEDPGGVFVLGQVARPGLVPHRAGASAEHYIAAAGGRGPAAREAFVRQAGSGALRPAGDVAPSSGDVVFVDRDPAAFSESQQSLLLQRQQYEAQVRRDRAEARNRLISTALGIASAITSVVTLIVLSNNSSN
jgi:protein involved in polysaccharide export with SLBB domain